jgi:hypothetical protein
MPGAPVSPPCDLNRERPGVGNLAKRPGACLDESGEFHSPSGVRPPLGTERESTTWGEALPILVCIAVIENWASSYAQGEARYHRDRRARRSRSVEPGCIAPWSEICKCPSVPDYFWRTGP